MKKLLLYFVFILLINNSFAQEKDSNFDQRFLIGTLLDDIAYVDIPNRLEILVEDYPCEAIKVTSDNGIIEVEGNCIFNFIPEKTGSCNVELSIKTNGNVIGKKTFYVRQLPIPEVTLAGKTGGNIPIKQIRIQQGILARWEYFGLQAGFRIKDFEIMIIRKSKIILHAKCSTPKLSVQVLNVLKTSEIGDGIVLINIVGTDVKGRYINLKPANFVVSK